MGTDFHLFKEGIEPKWEDENCANGGKWTYLFPKSRSVGELDEYWLNPLPGVDTTFSGMIGSTNC